MSVTQANTPLNRLVATVAVLVYAVAWGTMISSPVLADPSASTQQFFGFSGGGGGSSSSTPASCDISALKAQGTALEDQITQINNDSQTKLQQIQAQIAALPPNSADENAKLQQEQTDLLQQTQQQIAAVKAQQDQLKAATNGPSDQCKKDLVGQSVSEMQNLVAAMNGGALSSTMDKVDSVTTEIKNLEPTLAKSGVNSTDMATIKKDVTDVQSDSKTLRGFFTAMSAQASSFISQAQADPLGMYDQLNAGKTSLGKGLSDAASSAADNLVSAFTSLVNLFDKLTGTTGGN